MTCSPDYIGKIHALRLNLVLFETHKITVLRTGSEKSVISEISPVVFAGFATPEGSRAYG